MQSNPFVVLFTARSGSTALYGNLREHPGITMRAEVFGNKTLPGDLPQNDDNRVAFLRRYWAPFKIGEQRPQQPAPCKGFKLQLDRSHSQFSKSLRFVKVAKEYDPRVIVLRRNNRLKQALSAMNARRLLKASAQHEGHASAHIVDPSSSALAEIRKTKMVVRPQELKQLLAGIKSAYLRLDKMAESFDNPLEISYEEYNADPVSTVRKVIEHIGIDASDYTPENVYHKISSDDPRNLVKNYSQLEKFVQGTEYEEML